jgi:hypothetical protein
MTDEELEYVVGLVCFRLGFRTSGRGPRGREGVAGLPGPPGERGARGPAGASGEPGKEGRPGVMGSPGDKGDKGDKGDTGVSGVASVFDYSVNAAAVDGPFSDGSFVLRTAARLNPAGSFHGGGTGNKAILGVRGLHGLPLSSLTSIGYSWTSHEGPGGPNYNPPTPASTLVPYVNIVVDFGPVTGPSRYRILVMNSTGLNPAITASIGTHTNPGGNNVLIYSWLNTQNVLVVNSEIAPVPGVLPALIAPGPASWLNQSYAFAGIVAANPQARLVDAFPRDGGLPAGAVVSAVLLISGDSGTTTRSGKRILTLSINGSQIF